MKSNSREAIIATAMGLAQAHGYAGLNYRELAEEVGIKPASIYHYFPSKADLGAAVAKRYWEDFSVILEGVSATAKSPLDALRGYPATFRTALENDNRICLSSFMTAEFDDLPSIVRAEVQTFGNVNIAWLSKHLLAAKIVGSREGEKRARAIYAAMGGAQLMARGRADLKLFDDLISSFRVAGLLPG